MTLFKASTISLLFATLIACSTTTPDANNTASKATGTDVENIVVSKDARDLARTEITSKELGEKLVCTTVKKTGSKMGTKVCRTKAEVKQNRENAQDEIDRMRRAAPITSN